MTEEHYLGIAFSHGEVYEDFCTSKAFETCAKMNCNKCNFLSRRDPKNKNGIIVEL